MDEEIASYENFDFSKQEEHLQSIEAEYWENLISLWSEVENDGIPSESFDELTTTLYDRGIIQLPLAKLERRATEGSEWNRSVG